MPRVAFAGFLLAGTLASVAAAVGAQSKGGWVAKAPALLKRTEVAVPAVPGEGYIGRGGSPRPPPGGRGARRGSGGDSLGGGGQRRARHPGRDGVLGRAPERRPGRRAAAAAPPPPPPPPPNRPPLGAGGGVKPPVQPEPRHH